jgi:P2-related tail formation protein
MFKNYFFEILKFPLILAGGALAVLARGGAACLDTAYSAITWLRQQFLPATCEYQYLDKHGQSRGLKRHPLESEEMWRKRVVRAAAWHKLAGYTHGLEEIFRQSGYPDTVIQELKDERWAEFILRVPRPEQVSLETWDHLIWLANEYKRASSKLAGLIMILGLPGKCRLGATVTDGEICTIHPLMATQALTMNRLYAACAMITGLEIVTVMPLMEEIGE